MKIIYPQANRRKTVEKVNKIDKVWPLFPFNLEIKSSQNKEFNYGGS